MSYDPSLQKKTRGWKNGRLVLYYNHSSFSRLLFIVTKTTRYIKLWLCMTSSLQFYLLQYFEYIALRNVLSCYRNFLRFRMKIQSEHKVFPWLQSFITRKYVGTLRCTPVRRVSAVYNFSNKVVHLHAGVHMFIGFWTQHLKTGGLGEMVRHPGHHDRRISPPLTPFYGGMLRTKCFRHQFQILQIWRQE